MKSFEGATKKTFNEVTMATVPAYQRGGSIIPNNFATGELYFDDSISYEYKRNHKFIHRQFTFEDNKLRSKSLDPKASFDTKAWLERVIIYGLKSEPKSVRIEYGSNQSAKLESNYDANGQTLLIRKPNVNIGLEFT